jgi:hypothetical protein
MYDIYQTQTEIICKIDKHRHLENICMRYIIDKQKLDVRLTHIDIQRIYDIYTEREKKDICQNVLHRHLDIYIYRIYV